MREDLATPDDGTFFRLAAGDPVAGLAASRQYEDVIVQGLFEFWVLELLDRVRLRPGDRLLDVGCGTGIVARRAAPLVQPNGSVTGIDPTPPMLALARELAAAEGVTVEWVEGSAEAMPFAHDSFDVLTSEQALQFVPNRAGALGEMRRVAAPGARLGVAVWKLLEEQEQPALLALHEAVCRRLRVETLRQPFLLGDRNALHALLAAAEFRNIQIECLTIRSDFAIDDFFEFQFSAVSREQGFARLDEDGRSALKAEIRAEVAPAFDPYVDGDRLRLPYSSLIATATV